MKTKIRTITMMMAMIVLGLISMATLGAASNYDQLIAELNARNRQHHDRLFADPDVRTHLHALYSAPGGPYQTMLHGDLGSGSASGSDLGVGDGASTSGESAMQLGSGSRVGGSGTSDQVISNGDWELFKRELGKLRPIPSRRQPERLDQPNQLQGEIRIQAGNAKINNAAAAHAAQQQNGAGSDDSETTGKQKIETELEAAEAQKELENQREKLVKSDSKLPSYCNPPNPCPIGFDPRSGSAPCDRDVPDTKRYQRDYNAAQIRSGQCSCDNEHMHNKCRDLLAGSGSNAESMSGSPGIRSGKSLANQDFQENELNNLPDPIVSEMTDLENKVDAIPQSRLDNVAAQLDLIESLDRTRTNRIRQLMNGMNDQEDRND